MDPIETFKNLPPDQQKQVLDLGIKATEKLSNGIFKVLGYRLEAKHMKAMADAEAYKIKTLADAKAYEIDTIGTAIRNNQDLPVSFNSSDNTLSIDITNPEQLIQRSNYRLQYQQAKKEKNIESVIGKTVLELSDKSVNITEEIDEDWLTRFFETVEDISDEQVQSLWARILAGEVLKPRTYSYRFLSVLKNISKQEFDIVQKIAPLICEDAIIKDYKSLKNKGITKQDISIIEDMGLIKDGSLQIRGAKLQVGETDFLFRTTKYAFIVGNRNSIMTDFFIDVLELTETGKKLFELTEASLDIDYMETALRNKMIKNPCFHLFAAEITEIENGDSVVSNNHIFEINM